MFFGSWATKIWPEHGPNCAGKRTGTHIQRQILALNRYAVLTCFRTVITVYRFKAGSGTQTVVLRSAPIVPVPIIVVFRYIFFVENVPMAVPEPDFQGLAPPEAIKPVFLAFSGPSYVPETPWRLRF